MRKREGKMINQEISQPPCFYREIQKMLAKFDIL